MTRVPCVRMVNANIADQEDLNSAAATDNWTGAAMTVRAHGRGEGGGMTPYSPTQTKAYARVAADRYAIAGGKGWDPADSATVKAWGRGRGVAQPGMVDVDKPTTAWTVLRGRRKVNGVAAAVTDADLEGSPDSLRGVVGLGGRPGMMKETGRLSAGQTVSNRC